MCTKFATNLQPDAVALPLRLEAERTSPAANKRVRAVQEREHGLTLQCRNALFSQIQYHAGEWAELTHLPMRARRTNIVHSS